MNRTLHIMLVLAIGVALSVFFGSFFFYLPGVFENELLNIPEPILYVELSKTEITLGESFDLLVYSKNIGDQADVQIVSIGFPQLEKISDGVKITSYNFTQSPHYVKINDELGAKYAASNESVYAKYPSIEAYSRPVQQNTTFHMVLQITPQKTGDFELYAKAVAIPHSSDRSHFPRSGLADSQDEFVEVYSVLVMP